MIHPDHQEGRRAIACQQGGFQGRIDSLKNARRHAQTADDKILLRIHEPARAIASGKNGPAGHVAEPGVFLDGEVD